MRKNFDISVQRFDEFADEFAQRFVNVEAYMDSIDRFCNFIGSEKPRILELGCGPGNITKILKSRFPESIFMAIDLAPRMIEIARRYLQDVNFQVMDVRDISKIPEKFDAIMCSFCLPFLSKVETLKLIADCAGKLYQGGVLYISTMEGNESDAGFESTSFSGSSEVYFNYHQQQTLEKSMQEVGFEIVQAKLQDYPEPDGRVTTDMILIGVKK